MSGLNNSIGFMQGRLCNSVNGKIQSFPWLEWEKEFSIAASVDLHVMEWTLDQERLHENPLMTSDGQKKIRRLCKQYDLLIPSITGDCFMQAPFWKASSKAESKLKDDFLSICRACTKVGIGIIVVPLVDNGCLESTIQENCLVDFLLTLQPFLLEHKLQITFESDFAPSELARFIGRFPNESFGINYDMGNSASLGFIPAEEFSAYGSRIKNVHIKDRYLAGTTVPLLTGDVDFHAVFSELKKLSYAGNYILQTARAIDGDHTGLISKYRDIVTRWF